MNAHEKPLTVVSIHSDIDPSVALIRDGRVSRFAEEERFTRIKHAPGRFPTRALRWALADAGVDPDEVDVVAVNWDLDRFGSGAIEAHYAAMRSRYPLDGGTLAWQRRNIARYDRAAYVDTLARHWRRTLAKPLKARVVSMGHHYAHAFHSYALSGFEDAVALTIDGSGDDECTVVWECRGRELRPIRRILMPHSLGWFYAAITEYLGFEAYDGEYKVMGLASYAKPDAELRERLLNVLTPGSPADPDYAVDGRYIHWGAHTWSDRFTDALVDLLGRPPRHAHEEVETWHASLAATAQALVEDAVLTLVGWALQETGLDRVCIGGGVGLNIKMNRRVYDAPGVRDLFCNPLCGDGGAPVGAALAACFDQGGRWPEPLPTLALGVAVEAQEIDTLVRECGLLTHRPKNLEDIVAGMLAQGALVGWVQGRFEAGPRALGQRSILASPVGVDARERVNRAVKYREPWRPFCPSLPREAADMYLARWRDSPFMVMAFDATEAMRSAAPAVVHVDGTVRVQLVDREHLPRFHKLLEAFGERTGTPVLLNTSFNLSGEPIVATARDAVRTFFSSALDILVLGDTIVVKRPEQAARLAALDGAST
ncbi:carbamoyltransferase [Salinarimonas sp.]|uniref:carbamoyltransferase family protein n=1 Tax=Salinarimonas sp. TaxID=2766526 RepID=UPI00391B0714